MLVEDLIRQFILMKKREPSHLDELIDYIQKGYICGELSTVEYKTLFLHLKSEKAKKRVGFSQRRKPYICI